MPDDGSLAEFLRRIRTGDDAAAQELVRRCEPARRLEIKLRLVAAADPSASPVLVGRETLDEFQPRLTDDERVAPAVALAEVGDE